MPRTEPRCQAPPDCYRRTGHDDHSRATVDREHPGEARASPITSVAGRVVEFDLEEFRDTAADQEQREEGAERYAECAQYSPAAASHYRTPAGRREARRCATAALTRTSHGAT